MRAIIIKFDDLTQKTQRWENIAQYTIHQEIKTSIGIVGKYLTGSKNQSFFNWIKQLNNTGYFEFWNHGYTHERTPTGLEFFGTTYEEQYNSLKKTQTLGMEKLNIEFSTFGAPWNQGDAVTKKVIEEKFPEIKVLLRIDQIFKSKVCLDFKKEHCDFIKKDMTEYFFFDLEKMKEMLENTKDAEYVVLQFHPNGWGGITFIEFHKLISYLKEDPNNVFMTPYEFWQSKQVG